MASFVLFSSKKIINPTVAPSELAKTSSMSGVLVVVKTPWQISIRIPYPIAKNKTIILVFEFDTWFLTN